MFRHISLSVSGLLFLIIIAVIYFTKKKFESVEFKVYRIQIVWTILTLLLEISCNVFISYRQIYPTLTVVLCRTYIFFSMAWFILMMAHLFAYLTPEKYNTVFDVFKHPSTVFLMVSSFILFIISCFFKLEYTSGPPHYFNVIGGTSMFVLYYVFFIVCILMYRVFRTNLNRINFFKRLPIIIYFVLFTIMKIFQALYSDVSDLGFLFSVCMVATYFTLENQDYILLEELRNAKEEADKANKYKSEFLSKMSHEIRTPMNTILGFSENIINNDIKNKDEALNDIRNISMASKSLLETINNILLFSRIESGKETIENVEFSIKDLIDELKSYTNYKANISRINFNINIDDNIPLMYEGDKQKIYRVLVNIVDNAFNNTYSGNIDLNVSFKPLKDNYIEIRFQIKDDGVGIDKEALDAINRELNNDNKNDFNIEGKGIGFIIISRLIKMLDARLEIESKEYEGTSFTLIINQKCTDNKTLIMEKESQLTEQYDYSSYNVLIVDDNIMNIQVTKKLLSRLQFNIDYVQSGSECVKKLKQENNYNIVFLDHMMPEMDGIETFRILKSMKNKDKFKVVIMSANNSSELQDLYKKEGFDGYISKPIDINDLNKLLVKLFDNKGGK